MRPDRRSVEQAGRRRHRRYSRLLFALGSACLLIGLGLFVFAAVWFPPLSLRLLLVVTCFLLVVAGLPLVATGAERLRLARGRDRKDVEAF